MRDFMPSLRPHIPTDVYTKSHDIAPEWGVRVWEHVKICRTKMEKNGRVNGNLGNSLDALRSYVV